MAILDLLQAELSGVGASGLWLRVVEDRNMKFSRNKSIKFNLQLNLLLLRWVRIVVL